MTTQFIWLGFHTINIGIECLATRLVFSCTIKAELSHISENPLPCLDPVWHFTKTLLFFFQWFWPCSNPNCVTLSGSSAFTQESSWKSHISWATEKNNAYSLMQQKWRSQGSPGWSGTLVEDQGLRNPYVETGPVINLALHLGRWSSLVSINPSGPNCF